MISQTPLKLWVTLFVILCTLCLGGYALRRYYRERQTRILLSFGAYMFAICAFQSVLFYEQLVSDVDTKLLLVNLSNGFFIWMMLYTLLWFALIYSGNNQWVNRWTVSLAGIQIAATTALVLASPTALYAVHDVTTLGTVTVFGITSVEYLILEREVTLIFQLLALYGVLAQVIAAAILTRYLYQNRRIINFGHTITLSIAFLMPIALASLIALQLLPIGQYFTDIGLGITAIAFGVTVFRYRLLDLGSIGRKQAIRSMSDPIVIIDTDDNIVDSNPAARSLVGIESDSLGREQKQMSIKTFFTPFDSLIEHVRQSDTSAELTLETAGGTAYFHLRRSSIENNRGATVGALIVLQNVTQLKQREQTLRRQNERLERFAGVVSHDLRNPLTIASGYTQLLAETTDMNHITTIEDAHNRMGTIIDRLLTLTKAGETIAESELARVDLRTHAQLAWEVTDTPDATLSIEISGPYMIDANPDILQHIFENLFRNVTDHNDGPVTVTVGTLVSNLSAEPIGFYIADDGDGLPSDSQEELFEYGYSTNQSGTGLGLSIVQDFVTAHGWAVTATTSSSGGAQFEIKTE